MRITLLALVLSLSGVLLGLSGRALAASPVHRPDIVLFYLDDLAPEPPWLWDAPERMPEIASFVREGVAFENAISPTPLCGPSRGNLLTGRHGHASGMTRNRYADLREVEQIAPHMRAAGYATAWIGKYINAIYLARPTREAMAEVAADWDTFDIIWGSVDKDYGWRQYRKDRTIVHGEREQDHSSWVAASDAIRVIRETPSDTPLFLVISLVDGHAPLTPLERFEGHPACADIAAWDGPSYDEVDVADKPAYVQAHPRTGEIGYDIRDRCEVLMGTDHVLGLVNDALREAGRYEGALEVLAADNGWMGGDHRLRAKQVPYATAIPLWIRWPRELGASSRTVIDPVAITDLPVTFCALAGCTMPEPDGLDLTPLLRGTVASLEREYLFTEMLHAATGYREDPLAHPAWAGVDTTLGYDDTLWSYTRYQTGEEELYDLSADPYKLENRVGDPACAQTLRDVRGFFRETWTRDGVRWMPPLP